MTSSNLPSLPKGKPLNILLLGKTGHGKSATGNTLLEQEVFKSEPGGQSVTADCEMFGNTVGGREIAVVDTPGNMDTTKPAEALRVLASAITHIGNRIDAVVIVLNYSTRMTQAETGWIEKLKRLFEGEILDFIVVIFTHGDNYEKVMKKNNDLSSFSQYLKKSGGEYLYEFLVDCSERYTLFDNYAEAKEARKQVIRVVKIIDDMIEGNRGKRYRNNFWHGVALDEEPAEEELCNDEVDEEVTENRNTSQWLTGGGAERNDDFDHSQNERTGEQHLLKKFERTGAECFPSDAVLMAPQIGLVKMKDLRVGDKVLTISNELVSCQTEVYLFGHSFEHCKSQFACLKTTNRLLKITSGHFVFTFINGQPTPKVARYVSIGDVLLTMKEGRCVLEEVTDIWQTEETGLYAPFTLSGSIVVDGVLASCYVDVLPPPVAHNLLWPARQLYKMCPSTLATVSKTGDDGIPRWIRWCLDNFHFV